jgi:hypothetical protein
MSGVWGTVQATVSQVASYGLNKFGHLLLKRQASGLAEGERRPEPAAKRQRVVTDQTPLGSGRQRFSAPNRTSDPGQAGSSRGSGGPGFPFQAPPQRYEKENSHPAQRALSVGAATPARASSLSAGAGSHRSTAPPSQVLSHFKFTGGDGLVCIPPALLHPEQLRHAQEIESRQRKIQSHAALRERAKVPSPKQHEERTQPSHRAFAEPGHSALVKTNEDVQMIGEERRESPAGKQLSAEVEREKMIREKEAMAAENKRRAAAEEKERKQAEEVEERRRYMAEHETSLLIEKAKAESEAKKSRDRLELTEKQREKLQEVVEDLQQHDVRKMDMNQIREILDGLEAAAEQACLCPCMLACNQVYART